MMHFSDRRSTFKIIFNRGVESYDMIDHEIREKDDIVRSYHQYCRLSPPGMMPQG